MQNIHLLSIDPQKDFVDPSGALYVPGAENDMDRLARLVRRLKAKLTGITITLDSHNLVDISHAIWFSDSDGNHPTPFSTVSADDLRNGTWRTTRPADAKRTLDYLTALETGGRYPHVIWPNHCLIGGEGHAVHPDLFDAVVDWAGQFRWPRFVTKGSNPYTEHFSAVKAEVPDPADPSTQVNTNLVQTLEQADVILLAGEARSHCVANTVRDIAANFSDARFVDKMVLLTDATSDVPGFEQLGDSFFSDLTKLGMKTSTTTDILS